MESCVKFYFLIKCGHAKETDITILFYILFMFMLGPLTGSSAGLVIVGSCFAQFIIMSCPLTVDPARYHTAVIIINFDTRPWHLTNNEL